ncbi:MAG: alpha/beta hydrolase [Actinomycetota bacterium]|nr:alpha/beta hydrolase [Actinomycetota bacterium]
MAISTALGERRDVQLPDGTIAYRERGSGPPLVFVHGVFVNGDLWRRLVPLLADEFRCVVPDMPLGAHAAPMRADADLSPPALARLVADFLAALDLREVTLVGNDTGGAFCQLVVADHPERIGRLVLTNCDAFERLPPPLLRPLWWGARIPGALLGIGQVLRLRPARRAFMATVAHRAPEGTILDSFFRPLLEDPGVRRDIAKVLRGISNRYTLRAAASFPAFDRPVLIAWGEQDVFFPLRYAERLAEAFPDARLERIPGSRTFVPEDHPEALAKLIAGFVRE